MDFLCIWLRAPFQSCPITLLSNIESKCIFCAGDGEMFCVLPNGKISTCSRVTKDDDLLASTFIVGKVLDEKVEVDPVQVENLRHLNVMFYGQCEDCFAKWYCMGGCHNTRLLNDGVMPENHCVLEKAFLWTNLIKVGNKIIYLKDIDSYIAWAESNINKVLIDARERGLLKEE